MLGIIVGHTNCIFATGKVFLPVKLPRHSSSEVELQAHTEAKFRTTWLVVKKIFTAFEVGANTTFLCQYVCQLLHHKPVLRPWQKVLYTTNQEQEYSRPALCELFTTMYVMLTICFPPSGQYR